MLFLYPHGIIRVDYITDKYESNYINYSNVRYIAGRRANCQNLHLHNIAQHFFKVSPHTSLLLFAMTAVVMMT